MGYACLARGIFEFLGETFIGHIFLLEGSNWRFSFPARVHSFFSLLRKHSLFLGEHSHNSDKQNLDFCDT
jgi:hypothetical protein